MTMQHAGTNLTDGAFEAPFLNPSAPVDAAGEISRRLNLTDTFAEIHAPGPITLNGNVYIVDQAFDGSCRYLSRVIPGEGVVQEEVGGRVLNIPAEERYAVFGYNGIGLLTGPSDSRAVPEEIAEQTYAQYTAATDEEHAQFEADWNTELEAAKSPFFLGEFIIGEYGDLVVHDSVNIHQFYTDGSTDHHYDKEDKAEIAQPIAHTIALAVEGRGEDDQTFTWQYTVSTPNAGSLNMQLRASRNKVQGLIEETVHDGGRKSLKEMDEEEIRDTVVMIEEALNNLVFAFNVSELQAKKAKATEAMRQLANEEQQIEVRAWDEESRKMKMTGKLRRATPEEVVAKEKSLQEVYDRTGFSKYSIRDLEPRSRNITHPYALRFLAQDS